MFREILTYKDLLIMLVLRDIRVRYKQAIMGFMWAIFMPMVAVAAGVLIKTAMSFVSGKSLDLTEIASVSVKVLPWTFFVSAIKFSVQSLLGNRELVTKIYFPREVLTIASIIACLFDFIIAALAMSLILTILKVGISIYLFLLPILLIFLILFTTGLGLILAAANLFYRDVKYVVEIILMFGIFFTPVFYEASMLGKWEPMLLINPVSSILESLNSIIVLHQMPDVFWFIYTGICSAAMFILGFMIFHRSEPYFAESI